jgi:hypothetical protein
LPRARVNRMASSPKQYCRVLLVVEKHSELKSAMRD